MCQVLVLPTSAATGDLEELQLPLLKKCYICRVRRSRALDQLIDGRSRGAGMDHVRERSAACQTPARAWAGLGKLAPICTIDACRARRTTGADKIQ
jgi:hypothetical protein